jgi:heptosyltransferase II
MMQRTLILKLGATGDVVRTSALLRKLNGAVTWITAAKNIELVRNAAPNVHALTWEDRLEVAGATYDLAINLEDEPEVAEVLASLSARHLVGAFKDRDTGAMGYTDTAAGWFDLSLISRHGRAGADALKLINRRTYQEAIFEALGWKFSVEQYVLPPTAKSELVGDVAISSVAGPVWPMKAWAYYDELQVELERRGFTVNRLPTRGTLLEHLADVRGHRCVVCGDSLPMHLAIGSGVPCVAMFNCTSPWEICDYGLLTKMVSPRLSEFFYRRTFDEAATRAVSLDEVLDAVLERLCSKTNSESASS